MIVMTMLNILCACVEYLEIWKKDGARAIWIKIYIEHTAVVSGCVRVSHLRHPFY